MTSMICHKTEGSVHVVRVMASEYKQFLELENHFRRAVGEEPLDQAAQIRLQQAVQEEKLTIFLAVKGDRAVGMCTVSTAFSTFACREQGILDDFYVDPALRGQGVARLLTNAAQKWCKEQGFSGLTVTCSPGDEAMYGSLGFDLPLGKTLVCNF